MPNKVIAKGATVQIQGNVLDQSPAQPGTPAVSDSSMSEQMDYLHMQNATLLNSGYTPTGVQVTLTAVDPNNNTEIIGTSTTNAAATTLSTGLRRSRDIHRSPPHSLEPTPTGHQQQKQEN